MGYSQSRSKRALVQRQRERSALNMQRSQSTAQGFSDVQSMSPVPEGSIPSAKQRQAELTPSNPGEGQSIIQGGIEGFQNVAAAPPAAGQISNQTPDVLDKLGSAARGAFNSSTLGQLTNAGASAGKATIEFIAGLSSLRFKRDVQSL